MSLHCLVLLPHCHCCMRCCCPPPKTLSCRLTLDEVVTVDYITKYIAGVQQKYTQVGRHTGWQRGRSPTSYIGHMRFCNSDKQGGAQRGLSQGPQTTRTRGVLLVMACALSTS
jgi:hypothetical protein